MGVLRFIIFCIFDVEAVVVVAVDFFPCAVIHEPNGPTPHSHFEHSSIPATVKKLFNLNSNFLTKRDAWAGTFESHFSLRKTPRTDCPGLYDMHSYTCIQRAGMHKHTGIDMFGIFGHALSFV